MLEPDRSIEIAEPVVAEPAPAEPLEPGLTPIGPSDSPSRISVLERVRRKIAEAALGVDALAVRVAAAVRLFVLPTVLLAIGVGVGLWGVRNPSHLAGLDANKLGERERMHMLLSVGGALAGLVLVVLAASIVRRIRAGRFALLETAARAEHLLFGLVALPVVPALMLPSIERDSPKLTLFLVAIAAAISAVSFYALRAPADDRDEPARGLRRVLSVLGRFGAPLAVLGLWAGYGYFFSRLSITNHHALVTRTTDLGYYDNIFYQSIHGRPLGCTFIKAGYHGSAHFDPILVLLSPLYLLHPRAEMLLVLQSVWLGAGVVPVYLIAKDKLRSRGAGVLLALVYAVYPALHGANMYEFHSLTLATPVVLWLLYFLETGKTKSYAATLALTLLVREDMALLMCFVGLYAVLTRRARQVRTGWLTIAASLAWFAVVKAFFMTSSAIFMSGKDSYSFAYYYDQLIPNKNGMFGFVVSLVTNPVFVVKLAFEEQKIVFLLLLFLPLLFLPFVARPGRAMLLYGLVFCLLATRGPVFSIAFQYTAVLVPIAFALTPTALRQIEDGSFVPSLGLDPRRMRRALLGAVVVASLLVSWKFGGLVENASFKGGFGRVTRSLSAQQKATYAWLESAVARIPRGVSVGVTNRLGPHASNRKEVYFYPSHGDTAYVLVDEAELRGKDLETHKKKLEANQLVEVTRHGALALFKRPNAP